MFEFKNKNFTKFLVKNGQLILANMNLELSPLLVNIPFFIVNIYFEFGVYMFSNARDMTNDDTRATAIPWVFSVNSQAKNWVYFSHTL